MNDKNEPSVLLMQFFQMGLDHFIWDNILSGFGVRVSPQGQKTYVIQYRFRGRTQRVKLGRTDRITPDIARRDAKIIVGEVEAGKNPAQSIGQYRKSPYSLIKLANGL